uniref:TBCC domain-containing protein 1 n=1 Tax=Lygus hesperus TaxID=30085 RepID=A0A0A9XZS1_LYGHE
MTIPPNITFNNSLFPNNAVVHSLHNTVYIPPSSSFLNESANNLHSTTYTIASCCQTAFYIAAPLPHTRLSLLRNCTVTMGPVGGVLCVDRCEDCTISALCGAIVVSNCQRVNLCICTNTPPVLCMQASDYSCSGVTCNKVCSVAGEKITQRSTSLSNVRFAPYNSFYSTL